MDGATVEFFGDQSIQDALVVVAFPTTGFVGSIAGQFLLDHLNLPLVGSIHIQGMSAVTTVTNGLASSPIRIYGGEVECNLENRQCPRIFVIMTEIQMSEELFELVGGTILEWARQGQANMVLCMEGVVRDDDDKTPDVYAAGGDEQALQELVAIDVAPLQRAMLGGVAAVLLNRSRQQKVCTAAIVVEADAENPDGRAAVALIQALDRLIPSVTVDTKPLEKEALELEATVRRAEEEARLKAKAPTSSGAFI